VRAVCVFCGSSTPPDARYASLGRAVATVLVSRGVDLVYGGGRVGLMGIVADAALAGGGRVTGVIPMGLFGREVGHTGLTQLIEVSSMHERKQVMYDLSDAFIALPGGLGTLEELAEVGTWVQLGLHAKPLVLLDTDGFWGPLVEQLDRMVDVGFVKPANRFIIRRARSPEEAMVLLQAAPVRAEQWITDDER